MHVFKIIFNVFFLFRGRSVKFSRAKLFNKERNIWNVDSEIRNVSVRQAAFLECNKKCIYWPCMYVSAKYYHLWTINSGGTGGGKFVRVSVSLLVCGFMSLSVYLCWQADNAASYLCYVCPTLCVCVCVFLFVCFFVLLCHIHQNVVNLYLCHFHILFYPPGLSVCRHG